MPVHFDLDMVVKKQLRFQGSMCHTWQTWDRTMSLLSAGDLDLSPLVTERLPLSRWAQGFNDVIARKGVKILLYPDG